MSVLEVMYIHNICGTTECGMESLTSRKGSLDFSEVVQGELVRITVAHSTLHYETVSDLLVFVVGGR